MRLHVMHIVWNGGEDDSTTKDTIGCLVASLENEILLSSTYDGEYDHFPVVFSIPTKAILDIRTICILEEP